MNFIRLYIYPVVIAILIPLLVLVPYLIAIHQEHVAPFLPYTIAVLSYLQYLQINTIYTLSETVIQLKASIMKNRSKIIKFNRWSLFVAIYIVLALTSVVSFRSNEFPIIHPIIVITLFIAILVFIALKSWLSLRLSPQINTKLVAKARVIISVIMLISFIISLVCGIWAFAVTKNTKVKQRLNWDSKDDGYIPHVISAITQWLFLILLSPFFATYFKEMKAMTIHNGV
ncbi:unnamed protein product, partial [Oppiella nova]